MKLLHKKSIMECDEIEEEIHHKEVNDIFNALANMENYDVIVSSYRADINSKYKLHCEAIKLHDLEKYLEAFDFKNGVDFGVSEELITIDVYGQGYEAYDFIENKLVHDYQKQIVRLARFDHLEVMDLAHELEEQLQLEITDVQMEMR